MSLPTWTPAALSSEARPISGRYWRLVEAQHQVSTLKLVDLLEEQALLENLLEESKPALPPECVGLDYLLATPFRYGAIYPYGSRFRRAGRTLGVFYASEQVETALAEMSFYRLLFFGDSPETPLPANAAEYTAFAAAITTKEAIDLARSPLDRDREAWADPVNYGRLPVARRRSAGRGHSSDPLQVCPRSQRRQEYCASDSPCLRRSRTRRASDLAYPAIANWRAGALRFSESRIGFARGDFGADPRMRNSA